jgi:hypothetical protein
MNNWQKPRKELIETAARIALRGGTTAEALADSFTRWHFTGQRPATAADRFAKDLDALIARRRYEQMCERMGVLNGKAAELEAEGWRYVTVPGRNEGFWYHNKLGSVNQLGGGFESFTQATEAAYSSAVRSYLH